MKQPPLDLDPAIPASFAAEETADPVAAAGFEVGFEHARYGLAPPASLLLDCTPVGQGWRAGRAVFGRRPRPATAAVRQWLELRTEAWRAGVVFEPLQLTPQFLARIRVDRCPVLRLALGGGRHDPAAACVERLNPRGGYAAGNVALLSRAALTAGAGVDHTEAVRRARRAQDEGAERGGLDAGAWWRLAALRSYATPLPFPEAAALPLAVLPPSRVRLLNAVQGLQALLTLQFTAPGCGERLRAFGDGLPAPALRQDFALWVGALMPRALEAQPRALVAQPRALTAQPPTHGCGQALEDAWLAERVLRRWLAFALGLGETGVAAQLERALALPVPGRVAVEHGASQAVDGWSLGSDGRLSGVAAESRRPAAPTGPAPMRPQGPSRVQPQSQARAHARAPATVQARSAATAEPAAMSPTRIGRPGSAPPAGALPALRRRTGRTPASPVPRATAAPPRAAR
ncbi:MAG: hypothetical protein ACK57L_04145 [Pseudomonadota bacterium]